MGEKSFVGHARTIGFFTLLSRILGLARDILSSYFFGAGILWDAFTIAYRVPNLFRRLFGEGALTAAFIPAFVSRWDSGRTEEARGLFSRLITILGLLLLAIVAVGIAATFVLPVFWPDAKTILFSQLLRIMLPYLFLICTAAILAATLQSLRHFTMPALAPMLLNVVWIGALFLSAGRHIHLVAGAIVVGGVLQLVVLLPALASRGIRYRPEVRIDEGVREVRASFFPVVFGLALVQINELVDSVIAELCVPGDGAVSALYYGNQVTQLPLSLIGVSIATAVFPVLASPKADLPAVFQKALRAILYVSIPATVGIILFAREIVSLLFEHGAFDATDRTAWVLRFYAAGLWCYCANQVQVRAFYAAKDTRTPVRVGAAMVFLNLALNLVLIWPFREAGIAAATAVSGLGSFLILNRLLRRRFPEIRFGPALRTFALSTIAAGLMGGTAWTLQALLQRGLPGASKLLAGTRLLVPIAVAMAVYFGVTRIFGMVEAREILRRKA